MVGAGAAWSGRIAEALRVLQKQVCTWPYSVCAVSQLAWRVGTGQLVYTSPHLAFTLEYRSTVGTAGLLAAITALAESPRLPIN